VKAQVIRRLLVLTDHALRERDDVRASTMQIECATSLQACGVLKFIDLGRQGLDTLLDHVELAGEGSCVRLPS
jgi:hypothetical protein